MNPVTVRDVRIGEGMPKICAPLTGITEEELAREAQNLVSAGIIDVAEWRADWFEGAFDVPRVEEVLAALREKLGNIPLLFTFRTRKEGGEKDIEKEAYLRLTRAAIQTGNADLVDVELFTGDEAVAEIVREARRCKVKVVASSHDFVKTPEKEELVARLRRMQELGADLCKIAVMPRCSRDVLTLLEATEEAGGICDRPIITMSMAGPGVVSRLCGEVFGSALTFGAVGRASAPGQMRAEDLRMVLSLLHDSMQQGRETSSLA